MELPRMLQEDFIEVRPLLPREIYTTMDAPSMLSGIHSKRCRDSAGLLP